MSRDQRPSASSAPAQGAAGGSEYTPGQLVWVRVGKTDHHAHVVEAGTPRCKVKWCSTLDVEEVDVASISPGLTPRKRSRRQASTTSGDVEVAGVKRQQKKARDDKGGRLSLGRNRKRLAKARKEKRDQADSSSLNAKAALPSDVPEKESNASEEQPTMAATTDSSPKEAASCAAARVVTPAATTTIAESSHPSPKEISSGEPKDKGRYQAKKQCKPAYHTPLVSAATKRAAKQSASKMGAVVADARNKEYQTEVAVSGKKVQPSYHLDPTSSAYVQHIAELCHSILNDVRWRVPISGSQSEGCTISSDTTPRTRSVLAWENGDDLSAVSAFAGVFDGKIGGQNDLPYPGVSNEEEINSNDENENSEDKMILGRALLLYSRLFVRKGPWFTIDDLYFRYYRHYFHIADDSDETETDETETDAAGDGNKDSPSNDRDNTDSQLKQEILQLPTLSDHETAIVCFFKDIIQLHNMRVIRSFESERECGIVAGNTQSDGSGMLLNASERSEVLSRLGGGKLLKRKSTGLTSSSGGGSRNWSDSRGSDDGAGGRRSRFSGAADNLIWNQMTTQRSVFASGSSALLPVRRHVHETILRKFSTRILGSIGNTSRSRSNVNEIGSIVERAWNKATRAFEITEEKSLVFSSMSSLRMREAPLMSLRRASRLYLCAVGGPGSMRGDSGTSGWASVLEGALEVSKQSEDFIPFEARRVLESSGSNWHRASFPGLSSRLGLSSLSFASSYEPILHSSGDALNQDDKALKQVQVFSDQNGFRRWETCAELRAAIDTLIELNDMIQYLSRRKKKQEIVDEDGEDARSVGSKSRSGCDEDIASVPVPDHHRLLTSEGRRELIGRLSVGPAANAIYLLVESTLQRFECSSDSETGVTFHNDAERIIFVLSVIGLEVLQSHFSTISSDDMLRLSTRPWLRHLAWESTLAYLLWDCVAVLEKKKCHDLAVSILKTILTGGSLHLESSCNYFDPFVRSLISRRVRGKAIERLIIDQGHLEKASAKSQKEADSAAEGPADPPITGGRKKKCAKISEESEKFTPIQRLCLEVITKEAPKSSIPFSAVRSLARRLKVPLKDTLAGIDNAEMKSLKIRCENGEGQPSMHNVDPCPRGDGAKERPRKRSTGYTEWMPTTDFSIANSIENEAKDGIGKRCAYVGWDDEDYGGGMARTRSMNVEEHALAEYSAGRLPNLDDNGQKITNSIGGWVGWHDEGGHVRALFRILCANEILGAETSSTCVQFSERHTIYLSPYHGAPLDLHVATTQGGSIRGFYERRRLRIEEVLGNLERLSPQQICDLVHRSITEHMEEVRSSGSTGARDALLCRDVGEVRTLSFLAAALGGKALAAIFRCLCYDYRHYAGGLPDLTMARAVYEEDCGGNKRESDAGGSAEQLVDLGSWIGEAFHAEEIQKGQVVELCRILADRDDEFLGCSKIGETGGASSQQRFRQQRWKKQDETTKRGEEHLSSEGAVAVPPKLVLSHEGRTIRAECMFVEVKSANDRLDARQEDWLNVLDRVANARVCKFSSKKKKKAKGEAKARR